MGTETTAAITGKVGVVRRDPMAMIPFCGYNMADYLAHWLSFGPRLKNPPKIFRVNWFRRDEGGRFLWPGYGENVRILKWIVERIHGRGGAVETPIGYVPTPGAIDCSGLPLPSDALERALRVDREEWREALQELREFYEQFGARMPAAIWKAHAETARRFGV
jgi:phosphoenolpyruvate carboxykinase (GTP)